jgi:glucosyltransferase Lgt1/2/3
MKMTYQYNPHLHVKIWLSKNPDTFMNIENQTRLIAMREKNPTDAINLIYDSSLLNGYALTELDKFCVENDIIPFDANKFQNQLQSDYEKTLYSYYKDEIANLDNGGNLAVASDILRWIQPTYKLGTYTDLDFPIDTTSLPDSLTVDGPILLNIGSLKIRKKELILANNDFVAVVDEAAAKQQIEQVQAGIINKLSRYDTNFIEQSEKDLDNDSFLNYTFLSYMRNRTEAIYIQKSKTANMALNELSSRKFRAHIHRIMANENEFLDFNRMSPNEVDRDVINRLRHETKKQLGFVKWLFFSNEYKEIKTMLSKDDDKFLEYLMKKERSLYLKSIVICTTGPIEIANSLFNGYVLDSQEVHTKAEPLSFNHYHLQKAFQSKNSIPMHENILGMLKFLGAADGELNDSSWLEEGIKLQGIRQKKLLDERQKFQSYLPFAMLSMQIGIEKHIRTLQKDDKGFFGVFRRSIRSAKIEALQRVLTCFDSDTFDVVKFRSILNNLESRKRVVFYGFFSSRTQKLVEDLEELCHSSVIYRLTTNHKIKIINERARSIPSDTHHMPHQATTERNMTPTDSNSSQASTTSTKKGSNICFSFFSRFLKPCGNDQREEVITGSTPSSTF